MMLSLPYSDRLAALWCLLVVCMLIPATVTKAAPSAKLEPPSTTTVAAPLVDDIAERDEEEVEVPDSIDHHDPPSEKIVVAASDSIPPPGPVTPPLATSVPGRQPLGDLPPPSR
jgi:hypothetical protein